MNIDSLTFERSIQAPLKQVYRALTSSTALREWLCDTCTTEPRPGGRMYMWWNSGFYTCGEFLETEADQKIVYTWFGRGDPAPTQVEISLSGDQDTTRLKLVHSGLGSTETWVKTAEEIHKGWENGLANLVHTLEQGPDLRVITRPMMGIGLDDFNETIAQEIGVPVSKGVRISNAIEGMGAQAAGLRNNDVIVGLSGFEVTDFASLTAAMHGRKAGEEVHMTFYRGAEKMTVSMKLSQRPIPVIPPTAAELAEAVRPQYAQVEADLEMFLQGISEEDAQYKPGEKEWSIKEVLTHLIHSERGWQNALGEIIIGAEPAYDDFGGNVDVRNHATLVAFPTLNDLLTELKRLYIESQALLVHLPPDFVARIASYWRVGFQVLQFNIHFQIHLEQMQAVMKAKQQ